MVVRNRGSGWLSSSSVLRLLNRKLPLPKQHPYNRKPPLPKQHPYNRRHPVSHLYQLNQKQVEQALQWLASPVQEPPPEELESLSQVEWFLLGRMLESLLQEKEQSPLQ